MPVIMKKVAVIGAGPAGLAVTRVLAEDGNFEICTFEQSDSVGGIWKYTNDVGQNVHSNIYKNLRTNLPKDVMEFPGFPYKVPENESFISAGSVFVYLEDFVDYFGLAKYIQLSTKVTDISYVEKKWAVTILEDGKESRHTFDAVMICSGMYSKPLYPNIPGRETFKGDQRHSRDYRQPEVFAGKTVLVIGAGPSGLDITFDLEHHAGKILFSNHIPPLAKMYKFPPNCELVPDVKSIDEYQVTFVDGSARIVHSIIYCTGYTFQLPFVNENSGIRVVHENGRPQATVKPLYKHMFNIEHPTMCFIGLPREIIGNASNDLQARVFVKYLKGNISLPSAQEMLASEKQEMEEARETLPKWKPHYMRTAESGTAYVNSLAKMGDVPPIKPVYVKMFYDGINEVKRNFNKFRSGLYTVLNDNEYTLEYPN